MRAMLFISLFFILVFESAWAAEKSESFIVKAYDRYYKVVAPARKKDTLSVIIENKTLVDLVGRLQTQKGKNLAFVRVNSGKYKAFELKDFRQKDKVLFIPMAPSFQAIELRLGEKSYEIPPKR